MKTLLITVVIFLVVLAIVPVGGMSKINEYADYYMYLFLSAELLVIFSIIRIAILNYKKRKL